ncbi:B12-binding domain-containing radical SAM protein [bacterium]|nr:B12-binding domain-containing radical SAM protein [candidate division CSSED10-310 bacterium]
MKVLLISVENTLVCFGVRMISATLKREGWDTHILFLPREFNDIETAEEIDSIAEWVTALAPDIIGISLMSSHWRRAVNLTSAIHRLCRAPVVWGGIHPTIAPDECLEHADIVCVGEGEEPMVELIRALSAGETAESISNLWLRTPSGIVRNPPRDRKTHLDDLPYPDHDDETHTVRFRGRFSPVTEAVWRSYIPGFMDTHYVMSSRGCPHNCTYCCNSALREVTGGPYLRRRSPAHFVGEMIEIKNRFPHLKGFVFMDDSFFYGNTDWFVSFCTLYKTHIGLPFFCWANPAAVTADRIDMLAPAGLVGVHVGLESGSERISEDIYQRKVSLEQFYRCMDVLYTHRRQIGDIRVDVITDNPYETDEDVAATIRVLSYLKKPFFVGIVSLIFYPRTVLEQWAVRDGLVTGGNDALYNQEFFKYRPTMLNRLMRTVPKTPGSVIRFFLRHRSVRWGRVLFHIFYWGYFIGIRRQMMAVRRRVLLTYLALFERIMDPADVVKMRVSLIDF